MAKRILVPLDKSMTAEAVVDVVADTARGGGATVRLLHVAAVPDNVETEGRVIAYVDQEMTRLSDEALDYLRAVEARLDGVPVEIAVRFGDPVSEILADADSWGADLLALTIRCRHRLARLIVGSTADEVCRRAPVPVLLLRVGDGE